MNRKNSILIVILIILTMFTGCGSKAFDSEYKNFKETFIIATSFVDNDKDILVALKNIDIRKLELELVSMKTSLDKISCNLNSKSQQGIYENLGYYYEDLEFLLNTAKNIDGLSIEEKREAYRVATILSINRDSIIRGDE